MNIYPIHDFNLSKITKTYADDYTHWHFFFRCGCYFREDEDATRSTYPCRRHKVRSVK
jgi:hypothetical protein